VSGSQRLAAVVLAAGAGTRLRPLTELLPKALCPVGDRPLVDLALARVGAFGDRPVDPSWVAVNAHHLAGALAAHLDGSVHVSVEQPAALGTAGALGALRDWLDGRAVLVTNVDAYLDADLGSLAAGWDGARPRLAVVADGARPDFGGRWRYAGVGLLPWAEVQDLEPRPSGLYEASWRVAELTGRLELVPITGRFVDCGTPSDYLRANLYVSGGRSVVGAGAVVEGELVRSVVWPGGVVAAGERLVECVRAGRDVTLAAPQ
jgi:N-acetyl-alpha-D-muramate 1-phosphate uridylyltransferase